MSYEIEEIAAGLKAAREARDLSQRELAGRSGATQAQISKLENAETDPRLSSVMAIARALDLELMLVPRRSISAVRAIVRSETARPKASSAAANSLTQIEEGLTNLELDSREGELKNELRSAVRLMRSVSLTADQVDELADIARTLRQATKPREITDLTARKFRVHEVLRRLVTLRNSIAHGRTPTLDTATRPAYSLDEDDHG